MGRFFSLETPLAPGPLHCGQFASSSTNANVGKGSGNKQTIKMRVSPFLRLNNLDLISSKQRVRIEVIGIQQYAPKFNLLRLAIDCGFNKDICVPQRAISASRATQGTVKTLRRCLLDDHDLDL